MPRDSAKCRKWEQERRNRLREKFNELAKALPSYDPSKPLCHVNILEEARKAIEELQGDIKRILTEKNHDKVDSVKDEFIKKLQKRIKKLLIRNEELHNLLKNGGNPNQKVFNRSRHIKISPELAKKLQQQEMEKENTNKLAQGKKKKTAPNGTQIAAKHCNKRKNAKTGKSVAQNNKSASNCLLFLPPGNTGATGINQGLNQSFYLITNPASGTSVKSQKIGLPPAPIITRNVACINPSVPTLGPGTIVFSNGNILPIVQQSIVVKSSKPITSLQKNTFELNLPTITTPKIVTNTNISNTANIVTKEVKKLAPILPLRKCSTNITHVNKVPIPALSSNYTISHPVVINTPKKRRRSGRVQTVTARALRMINRKNTALKRKGECNIDNKSKKSKETEETTQSKQETDNINAIPDTITVSSQMQCSVVDVLEKSSVNQTDHTQKKNTLDSVQAEKQMPDTNDKSEKHTLVQEQFEDVDFGSSVRTTALTNNTNIIQDDLKTLELNLSHSELSNEIFATLQVPSGCQNPESTSPTAAFLLTFPLVSSLKGTDEDNNESQSGPPGLMQIGSKTTQNSNVLNIDNFSFFSSKNICEGFYSSYDINTENMEAEGLAKNNTFEQNLAVETSHNELGNNCAQKELIDKGDSDVNSKTSQKECDISDINFGNQEPKQPSNTIPALTIEEGFTNHQANKVKELSNSKQSNMIILEQIIISKNSSTSLKGASKNVEKENISNDKLSNNNKNQNLNQNETNSSSTTESAPINVVENEKANSSICLNSAKRADTVEDMLNESKKPPDTIFWNLKSIVGIENVNNQDVSQVAVKPGNGREAQNATHHSLGEILTQNQAGSKCEVKQVANMWNSKSIPELCTNTNTVLNQQNKSLDSYYILTANSEDDESVHIQKKDKKHFWNADSIVKLEDSIKGKNFQFDKNSCPPLWNSKSSQAQNTNVSQTSAQIDQVQSKNIWNPKPEDKITPFLETNAKNNYKELSIKRPDNSDSKSDNNASDISIDIKKQSTKVHNQTDYVWNTSDDTKKQPEQKQDNNSIWNPDLIAPAELNKQQQVRIQNTDNNREWNPELGNPKSSMQTPHQNNSKPEKYTWPTNSSISTDNMKDLPANQCDKKQQIHLWKNDSLSTVNKEKVHTDNIWNVKSTVGDFNKNQDPNQHKRSIDFNKTQGNIQWNPEPQYKSHVKIQDSNVLKSESLQSLAKQNNLNWNPDMSKSFEPSKHKQNSNTWNAELQISANLQNSSIKKQGNNLWNPDSVVATDNAKRLLSLQLDKKQGSHLWNPESVVAEELPVMDKQPLWPSDSLVSQNIHTCNRYSSLNVRQTIENAPNVNPVVHCSKHKDISNTSTQLFQNVPNNTGNMWTPPYYVNNNQLFPKVHDYDLVQTKEKQNQNTWTADSNRTILTQGKKQDAAVKGTDNMKSNNIQYNTQSFGSNANLQQNSGMWTTSILEKQQNYKSQEISNTKQSDNNLTNQNDFGLQYNVLPDSTNQMVHNSEKKDNTWNSHQHQVVTSTYDYNIQQEKSKTSKKNIIHSADNVKNQNSHVYSQNNQENQNIWTLHSKETQASSYGHDKNTQNHTDKSLTGNSNFSTKHNSKLTDSDKPQDSNMCTSLTDKRVNNLKTSFEFTNLPVSTNNNFGIYLDSSIKGNKNTPCNTNYNTFSDKNKDTNKKTNSPSTNVHQNINQTKTEAAKQSEQKSHYYFPTIYPAGDNGINFQNNDTIKTHSTAPYMNFNNNYANPLYTNSVNYNYNATDTTFNQNYYKSNNFQDPLYSTPKYYHSNTNCSRKTNVGKGKNLPQTKPVNWMTTPENKSQMVDCFLPTFSTQSYSFTSCVITTTEANGTNQIEVKKNSTTEDKQQFSWSPSKYPNFVETAHNFVTPTLPTLVGDLALSNSNFGEQKSAKETKKKTSENQANFLSVSQLVDQGKSESAKIVARRNSGGRSKTSSSSKSKRSNKTEASSEKVVQGKLNSNHHCFDMMSNSTENFYEKNRNVKNVSSNYSAEALIGNQVTTGKRIPDTTGKSQCTNFLTDNIVTYFPPVDENYIISNQNFQNANFPHTFQNTPYTTNNFIYTSSTMASTYLPNTFEPTLPEYSTDNLGIVQSVSKDKSPPNKNVKPSKEDKTHCPKKNKKKQVYEAGLSGIEYPFLPVPGSTNSPLLPDDFQAHTGLLSSAAASYPCKNAVYQKSGAEFNTNPLLPLPGLPKNTIQQPEISPINSVSTFTNFNLSSIFPEINKGASSNIFQENAVKDTSNSTALQVPFNIEPKYSFPQL